MAYQICCFSLGITLSTVMDLCGLPELIASPGGVDLRRVRFLVSMVRTWFEIGAGLGFLLWTVRQVPLAMRISGEFSRRLAAVVTGPLFVFFFSNVIVVAIIAKSRGAKVEEEGQRKKPVAFLESHVASPCCAAEEAVIYHDKEVITQSHEEEGPPVAVTDSEKGSPEDKMSDAEFQLVVDHFIARHLKLRREESLSIVVDPTLLCS